MPIQPIEVRIRKLHPDAKIPTFGTGHSAGFDIYSIEDKVIPSGETAEIKTGIALEVPIGKVVCLWDRSGMGSNSQHRFAGLLDSDYRGEYKIIIHNHAKEPYEIKKGDKIVQGVIQDYYKPIFKKVEELSESQRGAGSFGSTGK